MAKEREQHGGADVLGNLDAWERVNRVVAHFPLTPKQASVLMTFSERTLQDWRKKGSGPVYYQGGARVDPDGKVRPAAGTNQHVRYFRQDILDWWSSKKVASVTMAAKLKGQTFVTSIQHLLEEVPFYVDARGQIEGLVEHGTLDQLLKAHDERIHWLPVEEAAERAWSDLEMHRELASQVRNVLSRALSAVDAGLEATDIASVTNEGRKH